MNQIKIIYIVSILFLLNACQTKNNKISFKTKDIELAEAYHKYYENRLDYGYEKGKARDTILNRFKNTLLKTLSNKESATFPFDSLATMIKVIASKDNKLRIFSWDELSGGSWHTYNSIYQYNDKNKSYSGILSINNEVPLEAESYIDINHYKIYQIENNKYLVKGYGTHGGGKEFFVYRLLSFSNGKIVDCSKCFDGKDRFVYEISRRDTLEPKYNKELKEISYHELEESYIQGNKDEPSGFMKATGKILKLKYKKGLFIKTNN